jgi:hypothetical protein
MFQVKQEEGDAPFNMAMMYYFQLNELRAKKNEAAITGNMQAYYSCLSAIFNDIYFQIKDEKERVAQIKEDLEKAFRILSGGLPADRLLASQVESMNHWDSREILTRVDRELMILMDEKKMIFPRIDTRMGFKKVMEAYKLGGANGSSV